MSGSHAANWKSCLTMLILMCTIAVLRDSVHLLPSHALLCPVAHVNYLCIVDRCHRGGAVAHKTDLHM